MYDYQEACPVSKAASVLCERWTLQILREMMLGATRFTEFEMYLPRMSPSLLNTRLKTLEAEGLILKRKIPEKKGYEYVLTPAGNAIKPVIIAIGQWGKQWVFESMEEHELNLSALIRDFAVSLQLDAMPVADFTLQFNVKSHDKTVSKFIMRRDGHTEVCDENFGLDVTVYLTAELNTFAEIWYGDIAVRDAIKQQKLQVVGEHFYTKTIDKWLGISLFASDRVKADPGAVYC